MALLAHSCVEALGRGSTGPPFTLLLGLHPAGAMSWLSLIVSSDPDHLRQGVDLPISALSMSIDGSLGIRVNGEHRRIMGPVSVADMIREIGLDPHRVAVERNLAVVPRSLLGEVAVEDGDDYEIVRIVGGG
jgi:sulfur carrier protein